MQLVIKNNLVIAVANDNQVVNYPDCEILQWHQLIDLTQTIIPDPRDLLATLRQQKLNDLNQWQLNKINQGFDTGLNFTLKLTDLDKYTFASYKVLLDATIANGTRTLTSIIGITDSNNNIHSLTIDQFYTLMVNYGLYCEKLFQQYSITYITLINALTLETINAVQLPL